MIDCCADDDDMFDRMIRTRKIQGRSNGEDEKDD